MKKIAQATDAAPSPPVKDMDRQMLRPKASPLPSRHIILVLFIFLSPIVLASCKGAPPPKPLAKNCESCHAMTLDKNHALACGLCHGGVSPAADARAAHKGMMTRPAAPAQWGESCGGCHAKEVKATQRGIHFTLDGYERLRAGYGGKPVSGIDNIPIYAQPKTTAELADDFLRRRCLRCHLFYAGEDYAATKHGFGCAACHTRRQGGKMASHQFTIPSDKECLACHYGNRVGADYYGLAEHDLPPDFATPFPPAAPPAFGIESQRLIPDIHQQRGLICIDCHRGGELMATDDSKASCAACHDPKRLAVRLPAGVSKKDGGFLFTARDGAAHPLPTLTHPAHEEYGKTVSCQVCHAQWAFNDEGIHAIRIDHSDWEDWRSLRRQGVTEIDRFMRDVFDSGKTPEAPMMTDPFTGESRPGIWLLAYGQRRWETIQTERINGKLTVVRPADIFLSWADANEKTRFDNARLYKGDKKMTPYTPHTTGVAGIFWQDRLSATSPRGIQLHEGDKK